MQNTGNSDQLYYEYKIKSGDTLSGIMISMYGIEPVSSRYQKTKEFILSINPQIKNADLIRVGKILRLTEFPQQTQPAPVQKPPKLVTPPPPPLITQPVQPQDQDMFWALAWMANHTNYLTIPGGITIGASGNLLTPGNRNLINEISDIYAQYKSGEITRNQYNYQRKLRLDRLKINFGPSEKWLFGSKTTHQSIRIAKGGGVPATAHIAKHMNRLNNLSKIAKGGGIVLTGVGITAACMQIANTADQNEKNDIFVETVATTTMGIGLGVVVGLFLVSNPIGWGTALVLAVGTTAISYGTGKVVGYGYEASGRKVDFVSGTGVDKLCR